MTDWPITPLRDIVVPAERWETPVAGVSYRQLGVRLWGEGAYEREPLDGSDTKYSKLNRVEAGDLVVNKIWARNGSVAVVPESLGGSYVSGEFPTFIPSPDKVDSRWLHWLTKTKPFWDQCDERSRGTSGKNRIRPEQFLSVLVPLPALEEQQRILADIEQIATRIGVAQELRSQTAQKLDTLVASTSAFFIQLAQSSSNVRLEDVCDLITDGTHDTPDYVEEGVPLLTAKNVFWDRIDTRNVRRISRSDHEQIYRRCPASKGDILFINIGATTGTAKKIDIDLEFSLKNVALLRTSPTKLNADYLVHLLRSSIIRNQISERQAQTCQPFLALRDIRRLTIPILPMQQQLRVVALLNEIQAKMTLVRTMQTRTSSEIKALLPALLSNIFGGSYCAL